LIAFAIRILDTHLFRILYNSANFNWNFKFLFNVDIDILDADIGYCLLSSVKMLLISLLRPIVSSRM